MPNPQHPKGIQLLIALNSTAPPLPLRHMLIASADIVVGHFLPTMHIISVIAGRLWGVVGRLSLHIVVAKLASAVLHCCLFVMHIEAAECVVKKNQLKCRFCRRHLRHGGEYDNVLARWQR